MTESEAKIQNPQETWLTQIRAWEKELDAMDKENGYNMGKTTDKDGLKKVEHFQNQFIVQRSQLDTMKHNIKIYGGEPQKGSSELEDYGVYLNQLKDEFEAFCRQFY